MWSFQPSSLQHLAAAFVAAVANLGIRQRLTGLAAAMALPFVLFIAIDVMATLNAEREHALRQAQDNAVLTAARLDDYLGNVLLLSHALGDAVEPLLDQAAQVTPTLRRLVPKLDTQVHNVTVWSLQGRLLGALKDTVQPVPLREPPPLVQQALRTGRTAVAAPVLSRLDGLQVALFATPLRQGERAVGVLVVSLRLDRLHPLLVPTGFAQDGVVTVLDDGGVVLARSFEPAQSVGRRIVDPALSVQQRAQGSGVVERQGVDGVRRTFGFAQTTHVPWSVFVSVPTDVAMQSALARLRRSAVSGSVMLVVGLLAMAWLGKRLAKPIEQLTRDAAVLADDDMGHRNQVRGFREINQLAAALNRMAERLQQRKQAALAAQTLLRGVTDKMPALVSMLDREEHFRFANQAYREWLGVDPEALIGRSLLDLYGEADCKALRLELAPAWAGQRTVYMRRLGTLRGPRWVEVIAVPHLVAGVVEALYVMILDVTERIEDKARLARNEERLSLALEASSLSLFDWDIPGNRIYHSAQASVFRGGPPVESNLVPKDLHQFVHPDDLDRVVTRFRMAVKGDTEDFSAEYRVRNGSGGWTWLRSHGRVVERDANGQAVRLAGTDMDVSQRKVIEENLRQLAAYDHLTGLPNRAHFLERLAKAISRAEHTGQLMALLFLDIDHFKQVNDSLGHEAGDTLLKTLAQRWQSVVGSTDMLARLAGDEFTVILEGLHSPDQACGVAQSLVEAARQPVSAGTAQVTASTSVGVALRLPGEMDGASLLRRADAALYAAKRLGRGRWHLAQGEEGGAQVAV